MEDYNDVYSQKVRFSSARQGPRSLATVAAVALTADRRRRWRWRPGGAAWQRGASMLPPAAMTDVSARRRGQLAGGGRGLRRAFCRQSWATGGSRSPRPRTAATTIDDGYYGGPGPTTPPQPYYGQPYYGG